MNFPGAGAALAAITRRLSGGPTDTPPVDIPRWRSGPQAFEDFREIGKGQLGAVTLARELSTGIEFALKRFPPRRALADGVVKTFEATIRNLLSLRHACVLPIRRCIVPAQDIGIGIATEFNPGASLANLMDSHRDKSEHHQTVAHAIVSIALGMRYLHDNNVIHGALKLTNCLLYDGGLVKLSDYGLMKDLDRALPRRIQEMLGNSLRLTAPEAKGDPALWTNQVDVFSYGSIVFQLLTDSKHLSRIGMFNSATVKPQWNKPPGDRVANRDLRGLLERCWASDPVSRPLFPVILDEFDRMDYKFWPDVDPGKVRDFIADVLQN
jgi:serine/threonine protein kinase